MSSQTRSYKMKRKEKIFTRKLHGLRFLESSQDSPYKNKKKRVDTKVNKQAILEER